MSDKALTLAEMERRIAERVKAERFVLRSVIENAAEHGDTLYDALRRLVAMLPRKARPEARRAFQMVIDAYERDVKETAWQAAFPPEKGATLP